MRIIPFLLLVLTSTPAPALGDEEVMSAWQQEGCALMLMADRESALLRMRSRALEGKQCSIKFEMLETVLAEGLSRLPSDVNWDRFYFGRAIEHRWLSRGLAEAALFDERWDGERGTAFEGHPNLLVAELLARPELIHRIYPFFETHGFRVSAVGVEKVLGTRYTELPGQPYTNDESCGADAIVPFDAQVWLKLQPAKPTREQEP